MSELYDNEENFSEDINESTDKTEEKEEAGKKDASSTKQAGKKRTRTPVPITPHFLRSFFIGTASDSCY